MVEDKILECWNIHQGLAEICLSPTIQTEGGGGEKQVDRRTDMEILV